MTSFGDRMRIMRAVRGVNQVWLSAHARIALSFVVSAEQNKRPLNDEEEFRARVHLDWPVTMDELIDVLINDGFIK
jgi:hypothetical protein